MFRSHGESEETINVLNTHYSSDAPLLLHTHMLFCLFAFRPIMKQNMKQKNSQLTKKKKQKNQHFETAVNPQGELQIDDDVHPSSPQLSTPSNLQRPALATESSQLDTTASSPQAPSSESCAVQQSALQLPQPSSHSSSSLAIDLTSPNTPSQPSLNFISCGIK